MSAAVADGIDSELRVRYGQLQETPSVGVTSENV